MRTLLFALLLLAGCDAMPNALQFNTAPGRCCFHFSSISLPLKHLSAVTKTHHSCLTRGFIVQTVKGRRICYEENFQWAQDVFDQLQRSRRS